MFKCPGRGKYNLRGAPPAPVIKPGMLGCEQVYALAVLFKKGPQKESCADGTVKHLDCGGVYMKL